MRWPLIRLLPREFHFNFVGLAPYAAAFSAILIVLSGVSFLTKGLNLGIDFVGGSLIEVRTPGPAPIAELRTTLAAAGGEDAKVQGLGDSHGAMLSFRTAENVNAVAGATKIQNELAKAFPGIQFKKVEVVGPKVSGELMQSGFMALGIALALMLAYIWFRFQLQFGLGAVVAVFHDVLLTLGVLSVTGFEFSMTSIAALLTVIGYSMNEKVITFDRLRENLRKYKTTPLAEVINKSENERLSRTLITGSTAILALSGALVLGGVVLRPLVVTMVFGIIIGTYSSIYVALPIILLWGVKRGDEPAEPLKPANARP
ncbi:protein translocase subunit SecF [Phenylobacterium sp.]|uniref:protein translocase subunit SecF n=1 Tax=Phenylobacterium sp. TaxID=1871053 RepID=UPI00271BA963|nr:protein translocase subunit SecF [Phenylobacterium sp.]MDO8378501.1 protein translocase subunit SecF [Phenylobacterium sp.]